MSSDDEFAHLRIPLGEIASATNNFADENLIAQGSIVKVYKGQLLQSGQLINIVARKFSQVSIEIVNELVVLSYLEHKNIVSIFGLCEENDETIMVNKHAANGSLDKHLSGPTLTWIQRLRICVGVAHALSYIHDDVGRIFSVIHGNIKSSKILLDDNWEPKLSGFGFSMILFQRHHLFLTSKYRGTLQYMDPAYEKTRGLTHKSDVFSFGVVLFEVLFGRKASIPNEDNWYFARLAKLHYEGRTLDDMIDPDLRKQMDLQSFNIFSETAYWCLKEQRAQRPNMDQIFKRLKRALELQQKHENPEHSTVAVQGTSSNHLKGKNLEHLKIRLSDIELATEKFAKTYCIGSGGYGMVYKAELDHFDDRNSSAIEGKNKGELPKRRSTVAIKRIFSREDGQGERGFFAEIEMLTSCKHPNIVSLLGFCDEGPEMILVYEHASNGSLDDYLGSIDNMTYLTWAQRLHMCLDIAHGLNYLHTKMEDKQRIIHRDIKSANILLGNNWEAKIADFGLSKLHPANQEASTLNTDIIVGTKVYWDPEYERTGKLKKESDIYSFGVVLFEILCGRLAYDPIYIVENDKGLAPVARRCFNEGTLKEMVDPKLKEDTDENIFTLNKGPNQDSLDTFSKIAYQCLAETQAKRPTMEVVVKELEKALNFQENPKDNLQISLEDIKLITENFSDNNCIGGRGFWKVYRGEVPHANGRTTIVAKRLDRISDRGEHEFLIELQILVEYKHENIIGLVGYCNQMDEKIIVYEYASNGSLNKYLNDTSLTWMKRLKICIDVASGLDFLHGNDVTQREVTHRDIRSASILLDGDWKAKISNFGLSSINSLAQEMEYDGNNAYSTSSYLDPMYDELGFLTIESDIYSFGVVLFEILCGRSAVDHNHENRYLTKLVKHNFEEGKLDEMVFECIEEQIVPQSLTTFQMIAYQCLHDDREERPTASEVVVQLKKALEFQEDYEIWELKLPRDYKEIIQMSKTPEIYSTRKKKDLYDMLSKGILLQEGKVWFSLGSNGEKNEMISARKFSYKNRWSHK